MLSLRRHPISLVDATADSSRVYAYLSERLWFVNRDGHLFATMAFCPDDALSDVQFAIPSDARLLTEYDPAPLIEPTVPLRGLLGFPADYGVETPRTHGEYMGISRESDHEEKRRNELRDWARRNGVVVPFRFLYPVPPRPKPKSPMLLALKSAEGFVHGVIAETCALMELSAQDGHVDLYRGTLHNATETLRIIQAAIVKGETE